MTAPDANGSNSGGAQAMAVRLDLDLDGLSVPHKRHRVMRRTCSRAVGIQQRCRPPVAGLSPDALARSQDGANVADLVTPSAVVIVEEASVPNAADAILRSLAQSVHLNTTEPQKLPADHAQQFEAT
jgi:hypothetical protein